MDAPPVGLVPHLCVSNGNAALEFYKNAFGAVEIMKMPAEDGKRLMHAQIRIGESTVFLADDFPEYCDGKAHTPQALGGTSITMHQYVSNCDASIKRAQDAGAKVTMPAQDMFWGDRYGQVTDPFGHVWAFATRLSK